MAWNTRSPTLETPTSTDQRSGRCRPRKATVPAEPSSRPLPWARSPGSVVLVLALLATLSFGAVRGAAGATGLPLAGTEGKPSSSDALPAAPAPEGASLTDLSRTLQGLAFYRDEGVLEIVRYEDHHQHTRTLRFETVAAPPDRLRFDLVPEPGGDSPEPSPVVIWLEEGQIHGHDPSTGKLVRAGSFESVVRDLPTLDPVVEQALLIPRLLAGEAAPDPREVFTEPEQLCRDGSGDPCRQLTASLEEGRLRLWIGVEGFVRRLELELERTIPPAQMPGDERGYLAVAPAGPVWVRVSYRVSDARRQDDPGRSPAARPQGGLLPEERAALAYRPPAGSPPRPAGTSQPAPGLRPIEPAEVFSEEIQVTLFPTVVRVLDRHGRPVAGLEAEDFQARIDGREIPVAAVDWVRPDQPWADEMERQISAEEWRELGLIRPDPGQLVVIFIQSDFNALRIKGHLSFLPNVRPLLETLAPQDRVAVVAFGSHLELWQDFTRDRDAAYRAVQQAVRFGGVPETIGPADPDGPSLKQHFDRVAAKKAAVVEAGLGVVAGALESLSREHPALALEEKVMIFLGWGVGLRTSFGTVQRKPQLFPALESLHRSRTSVHVLDITPYAPERGGVAGLGPTHTLERGLRFVADKTGGTFARTYLFPGQAWKGLVQAVSGYYVLHLDGHSIGEEGGLLTVELRQPRGRILVTRPLRIQLAEAED